MIPIELRILVQGPRVGWQALDLAGVSFTFEWESPWFNQANRSYSYSFELPCSPWNQHLLGDLDLLTAPPPEGGYRCAVQGLPIGGEGEKRGRLYVEDFTPAHLGVRVELFPCFWDELDRLALGSLRALGGPEYYSYVLHHGGEAYAGGQEVGVPLTWWLRHVAAQVGYRWARPQGRALPDVNFVLWWGEKAEEETAGAVVRAVCARLGWTVAVGDASNEVWMETYEGLSPLPGLHVEGPLRLGRLINVRQYRTPVAATPKGKLAKKSMAPPVGEWGMKYHQLSAYQFVRYHAGTLGGYRYKKNENTSIIYHSLEFWLPWHAPQGTEEECDLFPESLTLEYGDQRESHKLASYTWDDLAGRERRPYRQEEGKPKEYLDGKVLISDDEEEKAVESEWCPVSYAILSRDVTYAGTFLLNLHRGAGNKCTYEGQLPGYRLREGTCPEEGLRLSYPHGYMLQRFGFAGKRYEEFSPRQWYTKTESYSVSSTRSATPQTVRVTLQGWGGGDNDPYDPTIPGGYDPPAPVNPPKPGPDPDPHRPPVQPHPHNPGGKEPDPHLPPEPDPGPPINPGPNPEPATPDHGDVTEGHDIVTYNYRNPALRTEDEGSSLATMYETQAMPEDGVVLLEEGQVVINGSNPTPQSSNAWALVPQLLLPHAQRPTDDNAHHYPLPRVGWYYTALEGELTEYNPLEILEYHTAAPLPRGLKAQTEGHQCVRHVSCTVTAQGLTFDQVTAVQLGAYYDLVWAIDRSTSGFELETEE